MAKRLGFRRIATRYDKLARNYFSALCLVPPWHSGCNQLSLDPKGDLLQDQTDYSVTVQSSGSSFAYVTNFFSDNVSVIRTSDNTVLATVAVGSQPFGVAVTATPAEACTIEALVEHVNALSAAGKLSQAEGHALSVKLEAARRLLEQGKPEAAGNVIGAFLNQVGALVQSRRLSETEAV